jgi:cell division protease FtsH
LVAYGLVMVMSELPDPGSFGAAFVEFMRVMSLVAEERESEVAVRLREHLGTDPKGLPTTGAEFPLAEHPNLQLALDAVLGDAELVGFTTRLMGFGSIGLAEIVAGLGMAGPISFGPVRYVDVEVGDGRVVQCVESALLLAVHEEAPLALVLSRGGDNPMRPSLLRLEGVSPAPGAVSGLLRELRAAMREHNVFRGRIISLHQDEHGGSVGVQFHTVPTVTRTDVILPEGTLERLERHTLGITQSARRLRAAGAAGTQWPCF